MDFQQLLAKMVELDQPQVESMPVDAVSEQPVAECPPDMPGAMTSNMGQPESPPPSMSLNLNAQGMDNIEQLMKLVTKVNPDMEKPAMPPMPTLGMEPSIASIKPSMPPLKMLPDLDKEESTPPEGEEGDDDDIMTHLNKKLKPFDDQQAKDKEEAFANSLDDSEPDTMDMDASIRDGDDLHKKKSMHKAAAGGDNAMAAESTDLRSQIRAELQRRLAEAKGAK